MSNVNAAINLAGDGSVAYRSEYAPAEIVTITRTGPGVYEIHGATGMPATGWRTSVPRGDSGLPLIDVAITDDDPIVIETSIDGSPADIPEGRVLSVRFTVPEPEPEPEPTPDA